MWSAISGSQVKVKAAGVNFSVNEKLEAVETIHKQLTETATQLKSEPSVSPIKIRGIEAELRKAELEIEDTESQITEDLNNLVDPDEL